jgi:hypothetical protein
MERNMETEKQAVIVVDIPPRLSAADVQRLVNGSLQDGSYYFAGITPYEPGALAFLRLRAEKQEKPPKPAHETPVDEAAAIAILEAKPRLTCEKMVALLAAKGIKRGRQWVYTRRAERGY